MKFILILLCFNNLFSYSFESRFSKDYTVLDRDAKDINNQPGGITSLGSDLIFISDVKQGAIKKLDGLGNKLAHLEGTPPLNSPLGLAMMGSSRLAIVDGSNHQIRILDPDGNLLGGFGSKGNKKGQLYYPKDILWDETQGTYLVSDFGNSRIQEFNQDGEFLNLYLYQHPKNLQFGAPRGIATNQQWLAAIYPGFKRIVFFNKKKIQAPEIIIEDKNFEELRYITSDAEGYFYVSDAQRKAIFVIDSQGKLVNEINLLSLLKRKDIEPDYIHCDEVGNLFLADLKTAQVIKIPAASTYQELRKASLNYKEGYYDEALLGFEKILKTSLNNQEVIRSTIKILEFLANNFIKEKNWEQASRTLRAILSIEPSNKVAITRLRVVRYQENKDWITSLILGISCLVILAVIASYWAFPSEESLNEDREEDEA